MRAEARTKKIYPSTCRSCDLDVKQMRVQGLPYLQAWSVRRRRRGLSWKVRSARDRTIRTIQIGVRSEFLESKENHEKPLHRSGMRPKIQEGAGEKGNKLPWGSEADYALAPIQMMLYVASKDAVLAFTRGYACLQKIIEVPSDSVRILSKFRNLR